MGPRLVGRGLSMLICGGRPYPPRLNSIVCAHLHTHTHNLVRRVCAVHYCSFVASVLRHIVYIVDFHPTFVVFAGLLLDRLMILPLGAPQDAFAPKKGAPAPQKGALPPKKGALPQKRQLCPKKTRFRRLKSPPKARNRQAR